MVVILLFQKRKRISRGIVVRKELTVGVRVDEVTELREGETEGTFEWTGVGPAAS